MPIRFDEVNGFCRVYYEIRYLVSSDPEKYDVIYNRIRYLTSQKSGITHVFPHIMRKSKLILMILYDFYDFYEKRWLCAKL